ncbi:MAG: hypothetical protein K8F52_15665 [Candidatus Scalindua rubra]|uniref:Uncharacterized protein n=1 Tax=Candidatus Scalindua brodae TaxID=237368 RepID=A0A0B0EEV7_9BACT|nr:MAG: hypothetical protein SCABRO_02590 [Candidatus Scalindua brodae]MBZ0110090.1 hypothetical protein [Candidatus Scalindua rubra]
MKLLSKRVQQFLVGFILMFAVLQLSQGIAHAKIYSPIDISPYDEQSAKILENGIKSLSSFSEVLQNQETKSLEKAYYSFEENPTDETYAVVVENAGQGLHTKVKTMKGMEQAILKVTPELAKYRAYLKKSGNTKMLASIERLQSELGVVREHLKRLMKTYEEEAKGLVTRITVEGPMKKIFPSSGGLQKGIVDGIKDLDKFLDLVMKFNKNEKSYLNSDEYGQGWEDVRDAIGDSRSKFGY